MKSLSIIIYLSIFSFVFLNSCRQTTKKRKAENKNQEILKQCTNGATDYPTCLLCPESMPYKDNLHSVKCIGIKSILILRA